MYIVKNALRCIARSKGKNILIGIIALVIAISACLGLSIRQASETAKASALGSMSVTATISYDRSSMMGQMGGGKMPSGGSSGGFDRNQFASMMGGATSLTLEEYMKYAEADSVEDFYYTLTAYFNGSDGLSPVSNDETDSEATDTTDSTDTSADTSAETSKSSSSGRGNGSASFPGGKGGMMGMFSSGDFTLVGYSSDSAMTSFINGTSSILNGAIFEEGTTELVCVISEELSIYNSISVGDSIILTNPSLEEETYTLTVCGIYSSSENNDFSMSMFGAGQDPANKIYMSAVALDVILDASEKNSTTITN